MAHQGGGDRKAPARDAAARLRAGAGLVAFAAVEAALYASYRGHDARFHWFTHFFVGAGAALVVMAAVARRRRRPVRAPLLWLVVGHLVAMVPDVVFVGGEAHARWMDVFLGHVSAHFVPGRNLTWYLAFLAALALYLFQVHRLEVHAVGGDERGPAGLRVRRWGEGPPVLFLHGLGASSRYWDRVAAAGDGYRGVAPDLLGFGRSPKPAEARYDVATHLAAIGPLLEPGAVVVGHSMGAVLAAALAAAPPVPLAGVVLVGLPAYPDPATARAEIGRLGLLARLTVRGSPLGWALCTAMCLLRPLAVVLGPVVIRDLPPTVVADGARHHWRSYSRTLEQVVVGHRAADDLAGAQVPVTLVHGDGDREAPARYAAAAAAAASAAGAPVRFEEVGGDHHLAVRDPGPLTAALARLLAGTGAARG